MFVTVEMVWLLACGILSGTSTEHINSRTVRILKRIKTLIITAYECPQICFVASDSKWYYSKDLNLILLVGIAVGHPLPSYCKGTCRCYPSCYYGYFKSIRLVFLAGLFHVGNCGRAFRRMADLVFSQTWRYLACC
jgi:hypothetical protein